jgi:dihydroflavonol-4-reductase
VSTRTAFVTGGTGFLGLNVIDALLAAEWSVVALHRSRSNLERLRARAVTLVEAELADRPGLRRVVPERCDAVFHVAGNVSMWSGEDGRQTRDNVDGTRNLAEAALARGARRFVHTSTVAVWGRQARVPFDERATKNGATSRMNYARSKLRGEEELLALVPRGLDVVLMNPCHIIGRYDQKGWSKMIPMVARGEMPAVPPGRGSFCDAAAVARAHVAAVDRGKTGENYLLGGPAVDYPEVVRIIAELLGKPAPKRVIPRWVLSGLAPVGDAVGWITRREPFLTTAMVEGLMQEEVVDSGKAIEALGYETVAIRSMLASTLAWQRQEGLL